MTWLRKRLKWSLRVFLVAMVVFLAGFAWFVYSIERHRQIAVGRADGIVALTGGPFRLQEADRLLEANHGQRLLVTGVHKATTRQTLRRLLPRSTNKFACCVDIDRRAMNTIGNAQETRQWVLKNRYASIIVVTSSYHMPRSLIELRLVMPDVKLIPYPVVTNEFQVDRWWEDTRTARILFSEYVKLLGSLVRLGAARIAENAGYERDGV